MLTDTSIKSAADAKRKGLSVGMYLAKNVFFVFAGYNWDLYQILDFEVALFWVALQFQEWVQLEWSLSAFRKEEIVIPEGNERIDQMDFHL